MNNMLGKIEDKLYELERKCNEKYGEDKCYKVASRAMIILTIALTLMLVLSFYFFTIATLKFVFIAEIAMLIVTVPLMIKNSLFFDITKARR